MGRRIDQRAPVVLLYHDVVRHEDRETVGYPGSLAGRYKLEPDRFREHLAAIAETGAEAGLIVPGAAFPAAAFTFDDGGASALDAAAALEERGWRGHFFVTTSCIGTRGFLTRAQIRELVDRGHAVGSHSHTHPPDIRKLSADEIEREWRTSREILGEILGTPPELAAIPGGMVSGAVIDGAARAGFSLVLTSEPGWNHSSQNGQPQTVGRYCIWSTTPASTAAAYVSGNRLARTRLQLEWRVKRAAEDLSPQVYLLLRRVRAHWSLGAVRRERREHAADAPLLPDGALAPVGERP